MLRSFLLFFIQSLVFGLAIKKFDWIFPVYQKLSENVNSYQNILIISESSMQYVEKKIYNINQNPILINRIRNNSFEILNTFINIKHLHESTIIYATDDFSSIKFFIDHLTKLWSVQMRPKCLVIFFDPRMNEKTILGNVLEYAWSRKFLDFTILIDNCDHSIDAPVRIYHFNPFLNFMNVEKLKADVEIFPEKLKNLHGYSLYLPKLVATPVYFLKSKKGHTDVYNSETLIVYYVLKLMNFSVKFKEPKSNYTSQSKKYLQANNFSMLQTLTPPLKETKSLTVSTRKVCTCFVAVVPILYSTEEKILLDIYLYFPITLMFILVLIFLNRLFKIWPDNFGVFHLVQIILGQPVNPESSSMTSRILYLTMILQFLYAINNFMSDFVKIQFQQETPFDSYDDLDKSNFKSYVFVDELKTRILELDSEHLKNLMSRTQVLPAQECINLLKSEKNVICMMTKEMAEIALAWLMNFDGSSVAKIAQPSLLCEKLGYWFEDASPFARKFYQNLQIIYESGLFNSACVQ